jgi:hypothetical protein
MSSHGMVSLDLGVEIPARYQQDTSEIIAAAALGPENRLEDVIMSLDFGIKILPIYICIYIYIYI